MAATVHEISQSRTSSDRVESLSSPEEVLARLRARGITELDDLLMHFDGRLQIPADEAARTQPEFERSLRERTMAVERAFHVQDLQRLAPQDAGLIMDGVRYVPLAASTLDVLVMAGWVKVERSLFRARGGHGGATIDPLALRVGLIEGSTTLAAARVISKHMVSSTESETAEAIAEHGGMQPSSSHVGRVSKSVGAVVEARRAEIEEAIRVQELVQDRLPARDDVALIVWSLDGIMVRMKDAPNTPGANKDDDGSKGHREAASATVALYNANGERLHTIGVARMPESKKVTLRDQLEAELSNVIQRYPSAPLEVVADAAQENWRIVDQTERSLGIRSARVVDCHHAEDHLSTGLKLSGATKADVEHWKTTLLDVTGGAELVLAELARRRQFKVFEDNSELTKKFDAEVTYFNNNAHMMNYPELKAQRRPIGSGVQEAACKSLVGTRLKRSGMSWLNPGGQSVITFRAFDKSGRFDLAWSEIEPRVRQSYEALKTDPSTTRQQPSWSQRAAA